MGRIVILVIAASFTFNVTWAGTALIFSGYKHSVLAHDGQLGLDQDRQQVAYENMVSQLRNLHGEVYNLPYDGDYIRTTIIPEINSQRLVLAPHYPDRGSYGDSADQAYQLLRVWFETYPSECSAYIDYLTNYIESHSN